MKDLKTTLVNAIIKLRYQNKKEYINKNSLTEYLSLCYAWLNDEDDFPPNSFQLVA